MTSASVISAGPQIVVLMVDSTAPEDIASFAQRVGETWKIGRRDVGDGLLLVIAKNDRRLWIAPAKALEGAVPDLAARIDAVATEFDEVRAALLAKRAGG